MRQRAHRPGAAGHDRANRVFAHAAGDISEAWRYAFGRVWLIRSMAHLAVELVDLLPERAGTAGSRFHVFELQNRELVHVDDEHETFAWIGRGRAPVRSALIARHRDRVAKRRRRVDAFVARFHHAL